MAELYYFQDIGFGEAIRIALDVSGISYTETTIQPSDWPEFKRRGIEDGTLPFGQLPLLKIDGLNLVESSSILRYLSTKYISPDVDIKMRTMIDIMVEGWKDVIAGYFSHLFNERSVLLNWIHTDCDTRLSRLEAAYNRSGTPYFVSDDITVVDCIAIATIENLMLDYPDILLQHSTLTNIKRSIQKRNQ